MAEARALVATWLPRPCGKCGEPVTGEGEWVVGHIIERAIRPDLTWEVSNWQPEHRACSDRTGQAAVIAKAKAAGRAEVVADLQAAGVDVGLAALDPSSWAAVLPADAPALAAPALPLSPPGAPAPPMVIRADLTWTEATQDAPTWLVPLLDVPDDASVPLAMTPVHPRATGTYGWEAVEWIERQFRLTLRWWQRLLLVRMLEHDAAGVLCWRVAIASASRRAGKSVVLRGLACWRLEHGHRLFGETQTAMHFGSDVAICREVQRGAWRWAEDVAGWDVTKANGKEAVETRGGDRWLVRSQNAVYGYDVHLGLGDETWDVAPGVVDDGVEPAMLERSSPQLLLTSTAHRRATSLMRKRIAAALAADDADTLLLLWAAMPQDDPGDVATWRRASPHWSEDRRRTIAGKYEKALNAEEDPELDDPNPMEGFKAQYLNLWRLKERRGQRGEQMVHEDAWRALALDRPAVAPDAVAIESWPAKGVSLALAWRDGTVAVDGYADLRAAVHALTLMGWRGKVTVGKSMLADPLWKALPAARPVAGEGRTSACVDALATHLREGTIHHDGGEHLAAQVTTVRTAPSVDGVRLVSNGRGDAIKAAVWALAEARKPRARVTGIVLPSGV